MDGELLHDALRAEPSEPAPASAVLDFVLVSAGSAAVLAPFVIAFALISLSGRTSPGLLQIAIFVSVIAPSLFVAAGGTPGERANARAGLAARIVRDEVPAAPLLLRGIALVLDLIAHTALGVLLSALPVALALVVIVSFPISFPMAILAVSCAVGALIMGRRPWSPMRSPGLELLGLRCIRTRHEIRVVRAVSLRGEDAAVRSLPRRLGAALWIAASCPVVGYLLLINFPGMIAPH